MARKLALMQCYVLYISNSHCWNTLAVMCLLLDRPRWHLGWRCNWPPPWTVERHPRPAWLLQGINTLRAHAASPADNPFVPCAVTKMHVCIHWVLVRPRYIKTFTSISVLLTSEIERDAHLHCVWVTFGCDQEWLARSVPPSIIVYITFPGSCAPCTLESEGGGLVIHGTESERQLFFPLHIAVILGLYGSALPVSKYPVLVPAV